MFVITSEIPMFCTQIDHFSPPFSNWSNIWFQWFEAHEICWTGRIQFSGVEVFSFSTGHEIHMRLAKVVIKL